MRSATTNDDTGPTSRNFFSQRLRLHYVDWGNPEAPPLVLVHGGRDHCRNWDWVARRLRKDWHVIAPDNHGPEIPCMPAVLLARKLAAGTMNRTGAMPCMGLVTLNEFAAEFAKWGMRTQVEELH